MYHEQYRLQTTSISWPPRENNRLPPLTLGPEVQPGGGGTQARSSRGVGGYPLRGVPHLQYPHQTWPGRGGGTQPWVPQPVRLCQGVPPVGGTPPWTRIPPVRPGCGVPLGQGGTPPQVPPPPSDLARGYPCWGYPTLGTPCPT